MEKNKTLRHASLFILLSVYCINILAVSYPTLTGAKATALSGSSVAVTDFWSLANNPALMPFYDKNTIGLYYDNRFLLKATSTAVLGAMLKVDNTGTFGIHISQFGGLNYGETTAGLAYAKAFAQRFSFGLSFNYLLIYFVDDIYGKAHGFTFDIGMYAKVSRSVAFGFYIANPACLKLATYNQTKEYIPTVLRLGLTYSLSRYCMLTVETEKDIDFPAVYRFACEYKVNDYLLLRGGLSFPDVSFACGVGTCIKKLTVDVSSTYHTVLGYSPQISLMYSF